MTPEWETAALRVWDGLVEASAVVVGIFMPVYLIVAGVRGEIAADWWPIARVALVLGGTFFYAWVAVIGLKVGQTPRALS